MSGSRGVFLLKYKECYIKQSLTKYFFKKVK